jgi:hypothetical protein
VEKLVELLAMQKMSIGKIVQPTHFGKFAAL